MIMQESISLSQGSRYLQQTSVKMMLVRFLFYTAVHNLEGNKLNHFAFPHQTQFHLRRKTNNRKVPCKVTESKFLCGRTSVVPSAQHIS